MARRFILALALALLAGLPAFAGQAPTVLGVDGTVFQLRQGTYQELFEPDPERGSDPVLALDVTRPGEPGERLLVPGADGDGSEQGATLALDRGSNTVYAVWTGYQAIHCKVYVVGYGPEGWTPLAEVSGNPFSLKSAPRLTTTAERFTVVGPDGEPAVRERTILHLVWWDRSSAGYRAVYTPLILEDGDFVDYNPVFALPDFLGPSDPLFDDSETLTRVPVVAPGSDPSTVAVGFVDLATQQVVGIQARAVPSVVEAAAADARAQLIGILSQHPGITPEQMAPLARAQLIGILSGRLRSEVASYSADRIASGIAALDPGTDLRAAVSDARAQLIGILSDLDHGVEDAPEAPPATIEIDLPERPQLLEFRVVSERPIPTAPATASELPVALYLSRDASDMMVVWDGAEALYYVESEGSGWSEIKTLELGRPLSREEAHTVLLQRTRPTG